MTETESTKANDELFLKDLWFEAYGYPMAWSKWLARLDTPLGELHRQRLIEFDLEMKGEHTGPVTLYDYRK